MYLPACTNEIIRSPKQLENNVIISKSGSAKTNSVPNGESGAHSKKDFFCLHLVSIVEMIKQTVY